jgi:hypothetical protein
MIEKVKLQETLGRPRSRWENNIIMELKRNGHQYEEFVDSTQDRNYWRALMNTTLNLWVP